MAEPAIWDETQKTESKQITIDPITRLEGHGKIEIFLNDDGNVRNAYFQIPELRGFEQFCRGRPAEELNRLTVRLCGVCPGAHHMASTKALDSVWGVEPTPAAKKLRELFYSAHYVHSHAAHFYALAAPDFVLGPAADATVRNVIGVVDAVGPDIGGAVIKNRGHAQRIQEIIGGKATHPVCGLPGGMSRPITEEEREKIHGWGEELVEFGKLGIDTIFTDIVLKNEDYLNIITNPDLYHHETYYMGMVDENNKVNFYDGDIRIVDPNGKEFAKFAPEDYLDHIREAVMPWTYLKFPYLKKLGFPYDEEEGFQSGEGHGMHRVAPLARANVSTGFTTPEAQDRYEQMLETVTDLGVEPPVHFTLANHWCRLIELLHAAERVVELTEDEEITSTDLRTQLPPLEEENTGIGVVEAPRGTLIHHYEVDENAMTKKLNLIVATGNNNAAICYGTKKVAKGMIKNWEVSPGLLNMVEMVFRAYDPCFSCATHAMGKMPFEANIHRPDGSIYKKVKNF